MARIITFSRTFPVYHPKKGEQTYFVEAILTQLGIDYTNHSYLMWLIENNKDISGKFLQGFFDSLSQDIAPKSHTIRSHKRPLKVGDFINPVCWAGKPYNKTPEGYWQIKFAPDTMVVKRYDLDKDLLSKDFYLDGMRTHPDGLLTIAKNDGLELADLLLWFKYPKPFNAKIYCWNENINY